MSGYEDLCEVLDATSERLRHARRAGLGAGQQDIYLPSGMPSGVKYRRIERPLAAALRYGWISAEQEQAGTEFLRHMVSARAQIGFTTSRWQDVTDCSSSQFSPQERKAFHQQQLRRALHALDWRCRQPFLDWMAKSEQEDTSIQELGSKFTNLRHKEAQKAVGITVLDFILQDLGEHFGIIQRKRSWDTRAHLEELLRQNSRSR